MCIVINKERCKRANPKQPIQFNYNGGLETDPIKIADHPNKYFVSM